MVVVCHLSDLQWKDRLMLSHRYCYHFHEQNFARNRQKQFVSGTSQVIKFHKRTTAISAESQLVMELGPGSRLHLGNPIPDWWFQPIWKIWVKNGDLPQIGMNKKIFETNHLDTFTYFYRVSVHVRSNYFSTTNHCLSSSSKFGTSAWSTAGRALEPSSWNDSKKNPNPHSMPNKHHGTMFFFLAAKKDSEITYDNNPYFPANDINEVIPKSVVSQEVLANIASTIIPTGESPQAGEIYRNPAMPWRQTEWKHKLFLV